MSKSPYYLNVFPQTVSVSVKLSARTWLIIYCYLKKEPLINFIPIDDTYKRTRYAGAGFHLWSWCFVLLVPAPCNSFFIVLSLSCSQLTLSPRVSCWFLYSLCSLWLLIKVLSGLDSSIFFFFFFCYQLTLNAAFLKSLNEGGASLRSNWFSFFFLLFFQIGLNVPIRHYSSQMLIHCFWILQH